MDILRLTYLAKMNIQFKKKKKFVVQWYCFLKLKSTKKNNNSPLAKRKGKKP